MKHTTKHKVLPLVQRLNDCVGATARKVYTQQISSLELLKFPQCEIQRQLPELCVFVDSLSGQTTASPPSSLVRSAFRHPDAQWLSRSARESGVSALVCQQLVRVARQTNSEDLKDENAAYWPAPKLIIHVMLDALLLPCAKRLGRQPDACKWCPAQLKPRFHAMTCFPVWSTLLSFVTLIGLRFPGEFHDVLQEYLEKKKKRVNCDFAQIIGIWRLIEELNRGDQGHQSAVTKIMLSLLQFACDKVLGRETDDKKAVGMHLDDQLMEKFFTGLQGFAFNSWRANAVLKPALFRALQSSFSQAKIDSVPHQTLVFMAVGCMYVRDLAAEIVSMLIERFRDTANQGKGVNRSVLNLLVGFCAHVDLVSLSSVLEVLNIIIDTYKAVERHTGDGDNERKRHKYVFYLVYVAYHRRQSVDIVRQDVSAQTAMVKNVLSQFQMRLCSDIAVEDFYIAAPLHWMAKVWKHWLVLSDQDVQTFISEGREQEPDTEQEHEDRFAAWQALVASMAFQSASFLPFPQMYTLLKPHLISPLPLIAPSDEGELNVQARKRRRIDRKPINAVDSTQLERSFDVLLLPDVMERVCSFMSAKRLCRMALVCRAFAGISHRASLWQPLYMRLDLCSRMKSNSLPFVSVECHHGEAYKHDWRHLYQERWKVLRRLRRRHFRAMKANKICNQDNGRTIEATLSFTPQICSFCGCNDVLKSAVDLAFHQTQHKRFMCSDVSCRASFTGVQKLNRHIRQHVTHK